MVPTHFSVYRLRIREEKSHTITTQHTMVNSKETI